MPAADVFFTTTYGSTRRYAEELAARLGTVARPLDEAREIWQSINLPNLVENILPTRVRASLVLRKGDDHQVTRVRLRKL